MHQNKHTNAFRILTIILIILQSIGIRFFQGQGFLLSIVIFILSLKGLHHIQYKDIKLLSVILIFLSICKVTNPLSFPFVNLFYEISLIFSTYLFIIQYRNKGSILQIEFYCALTILVIHAFIGYCIYTALPNFFYSINNMNLSCFYVFYVSASDFMGIRRNTGIFWEPGVFQLIANLYLFYSIKYKKNSLILLLGLLSVVSSLSTNGFIVLIVNLIYFIYKKHQENHLSILQIFSFTAIIFSFIPIFILNTSDKIGGENTSGIVRYRDAIIGIELIKEKPLIGHGIFDLDYLSSNNFVNGLESDLFTKQYLERSGDISGGYTNGLLGFIACFGIPMSLVTFICFIKNKFIAGSRLEKILFCCIFFISMVPEPISYTSMFLMFPLSYWGLKSIKQ